MVREMSEETLTHKTDEFERHLVAIEGQLASLKAGAGSEQPQEIRREIAGAIASASSQS